jgi:hypothetical protein
MTSNACRASGVTGSPAYRMTGVVSGCANVQFLGMVILLTAYSTLEPVTKPLRHEALQLFAPPGQRDSSVCSGG